MTRAEPRQQPRVGRGAKAVSGGVWGTAVCAWLWATVGVCFSSLLTASKATELAAELGGGVKIVTATYHDMSRLDMTRVCTAVKKKRRERERKGQELHNLGCYEKR